MIIFRVLLSFSLSLSLSLSLRSYVIHDASTADDEPSHGVKDSHVLPRLDLVRRILYFVYVLWECRTNLG
jgi:hypothetical protein